MSRAENNATAIPAAPGRAGVPASAPPIPLPHLAAGLDWAFLKRTAGMAVLTAFLCAFVGAMYFSWRRSLEYLFFACWALCLFSLTALILRNLERRGRSLLFMSLKLPCIGAAWLVFEAMLAAPPEGRISREQALAIFAGISTPLTVFILRAFGLVSENQQRGVALGSAAPQNESVAEGLEPRS